MSTVAGARLIAHLDQVLLKTFLIISLSDWDCRGNKSPMFWNVKVVVLILHSQAVISGSCAAVLPLNEWVQGGGVFEVGPGLGSKDSQCPTTCYDTFSADFLSVCLCSHCEQRLPCEEQGWQIKWSVCHWQCCTQNMASRFGAFPNSRRMLRCWRGLPRCSVI